MTFSPPQQASIPPIVSFAFQPYYQLGPLGVGIFFLISGFVISFSISKLSGGNFILARFFRIFPVYIFSTAVTMSTLLASALYWGKDFNINTTTLLTNLALLNNYFLLPSIDLVNWTLAIEIKFYLVITLLSPFIVKRSLYPIAIVMILALLFQLHHAKIIKLANTTLQLNIINQASTELMFISYMMIGVLFYYHYKNSISTRQLITYLAISSVLFSVTWYHSLLSNQFNAVTINYIYAIIIFSAFYFARDNFKAFKPLDFLANVSFPLYIIHSMVGYSWLNILMDNGISYELSLALSLTMILLLSYVIHKLVEKPSIKIGKKLTGNQPRNNANDEVLTSQAA